MWWLDLFIVCALFLPIIGEVLVPHASQRSKRPERSKKDLRVVVRPVAVDVTAPIAEPQDRAA